MCSILQNLEERYVWKGGMQVPLLNACRITMSMQWPKLRHLQHQVQENVKKMMSGYLHITSSTLSGRKNSSHFLSKPKFIASCSVFGPKGGGSCHPYSCHDN
ncbi:hypothetical protein Ancab_021507 [Ancistrocladus abbreviatus]